MADLNGDPDTDGVGHLPHGTMEDQVAARQARKLRAQQQAPHSIWFGLGMMGLIGWSVTIPALIGVGLGLWIDSHWPGRHSWSLMLLILGIGIGCLNAWSWVQRESATDRPSGRDSEPAETSEERPDE